MAKYYNVILQVVKDGEVRFLKYRGVNTLDKLLGVVQSKGFVIRYVNLYDAKTKEKLEGYPYPK